jgi:uncharacterized membrane protein YeaQ/YmgE (transglycosylase-associated protein family)
MNFYALAIGTAAVLAYDLLGSLAARAVPFPYGRLFIGSVVLYVVTGWLAATATPTPENPDRAAIMNAAIVGLVDASAGWAVSWRLGPGRPAAGQTFTLQTWSLNAVTVTVLAGACGLIGYRIA